jgi:hypothetical protein
MEQLTHDKQVSGSSTLVGSLFSLSLGNEPVEKRGAPQAKDWSKPRKM